MQTEQENNLKNPTESPESTSSTDSEGQPKVSTLRPKNKNGKEPQCYLAPMPGFVWNPLRKLPPNSPCPCRSLKKFKKCCLASIPPAIPKALADEYQKQMDMGGLTFLTEANAERLKGAIPPEVFEAKQKELEMQRLAAQAPERLEIKATEEKLEKENKTCHGELT